MERKGIVQDIRTMEHRCLDCPDKEEAARRDGEEIIGLTAELDFAREQHAQTLARKSNLMQDWLADRTTIWKLRCQIRGLDHEPIA